MGENECCLRAYDSRRFAGVRGGSIGKNLKSEDYRRYKPLFSPGITELRTYCPKILFVEC